MGKDNKLGVVDLESGEVKKILKDGDRLTTKKQRDYYKDRSDVKYEGKFVNTVDDKLRELSKNLTLSQLGLFASLIQFMDFKTKNLRWNNKPMTQSDISLSIGVSPSSVSRTLRELEDKGFVYRNSEGKGATYKVNEDIVFIGEFLKKEYSTKVYVATFRELIHGLKLNEVGLFYRLIPYLNTNMYVLSYNPNELDPDEVNPLTTYQEVANLLNMDRSNVQRIMNRLRNNDIVFNVTGRKNVFVFNPEVVTRKVKRDALQEVLEVVKNKFE